MPDQNLDRLAERLAQRRAADRLALAAAIRRPPCPEDRLGCAFPVGARVFDTVTGEEAIVIAGTIEDVNVPAPRQ